MRKPDFFIVGAPKCGTTAMNAYLKQHPEIYIPPVKDLYFFASDLNSLGSTKQLTEERYLSFFADATSEKRVGEASVWYLYSKQAAAKIKRFCPSAGIIIMLRNPVDMLYSLHSQFLYTGIEEILNFNDALGAEEDRRRGLRIPDGAHLVRKFFSKELLFYRKVARYTPQVQRYLDIFGRENVHVIIFDEFKTETTRIYKQLLLFLGVNDDYQPAYEVMNANKSWRSMIVQRFFRSPPQIVRRFGTLLPRDRRLALRQKLENLNTRCKPRPPMDPRLKCELQAEFAAEVQRLSELLGRDLSYWSHT